MRGEIEVLEVIQGRIDVIAGFVKVLHCAICSILQLLLLLIVYTQIAILKVSNLFLLAIRPH
jgi:cell division protein FtsL